MILHHSRTHAPFIAGSAQETVRARIGLIGLGATVGMLLLLNVAASLS